MLITSCNQLDFFLGVLNDVEYWYHWPHGPNCRCFFVEWSLVLRGERVSSFYRISPLAVPVAAKRTDLKQWWLFHMVSPWRFGTGKEMELLKIKWDCLDVGWFLDYLGWVWTVLEEFGGMLDEFGWFLILDDFRMILDDFMIHGLDIRRANCGSKIGDWTCSIHFLG